MNRDSYSCNFYLLCISDAAITTYTKNRIKLIFEGSIIKTLFCGFLLDVALAISRRLKCIKLSLLTMNQEKFSYKTQGIYLKTYVSAETESMVEVPFRFKLKYQFRSDTTHNAH